MSAPNTPNARPQANPSGHIPVLLPEVLSLLRPTAGMRILDGTLGLGGHAEAIMQASNGLAQYCGLDRDSQALSLARQRLAGWEDNCHLFHLEYARFPEALAQLGWDWVDAVLLDLGVSSLQLDQAERGFSLRGNGPLDMRMNAQDLPGAKSFATAADLVNQADYNYLREIIERYGEDPLAARIAKAIVDARNHATISDTAQLAEIVNQAYPLKWRKTARNHPATRTFQALRMVINNELGQLQEFLEQIPAYLAPGAKLAIISFHSLEDRLVKRTFKLWATDCICPPRQAVCNCLHQAQARLLTRKPIVPQAAELAANPRAASAKLRAAEKLARTEAA